MAENPGALTESIYYILLSLLRPLHGYGIMQNIDALTSGRLQMGAGTLYGALNNLKKKGWIEPYGEEEESGKKNYLITEEGRRVLKLEIGRLEELYQNGKRLMEVRDEEGL